VIDFRYHLVSIVAVFLALAIGIVIGAQALQPKVAGGLHAVIQQETKANAALSKQNAALLRQLAGDDAFAKAAERNLLSNLLAGQHVVLVTAPTADGTAVTGVTDAVKLAGATVAGRVSLQPSFLDTSVNSEDALATAAAQFAPPGVTPSTDGSPVPGQQAAATDIAAAIMVRDGPSVLTDAQRQAVLASFGRAGYLQMQGPGSGGTLTLPADLAVVITPAAAAGSDTAPGNQALLALAQELRHFGRGVVLAGTVAGSGLGSVIHDVSSGATGVPLATVDNADTAIGQIMVAQALRLWLQGSKPASYGVGPGTAPSPVPSGSPTVTPSPSGSAAPHRTGR
jgi:Copper transport outer membrane protein, MctB